MKNILVIGGSSGVGKSVVDELVNRGDRVYASFRNNIVEADADHLNPFRFDVMTDRLPEDLLPEVLDGIVYCPGSLTLRPFTRYSDDDFLEDYKLQVVGAIKVIREILGRMKKSESASVVLFSTVAVQSGFPFHAQVSASKGAIEGITRALAAELAPHIRVNAVAPSLTQTPLAERLLNNDKKIEAHGKRHPLQRIGHPSDISQAVLYLLDAQWVSGQILKVDGGMSSLKHSS